MGTGSSTFAEGSYDSPSVQHISITFANTTLIEPSSFYIDGNPEPAQGPSVFVKVDGAGYRPGSTYSPDEKFSFKMQNRLDRTYLGLNIAGDGVAMVGADADPKAVSTNMGPKYYVIDHNLSYLNSMRMYAFQIKSLQGRGCVLGSAIEGDRVTDHKRPVNGTCPTPPSQGSGDSIIKMNMNTIDQVDDNYKFLSSLWTATINNHRYAHLNSVADLLRGYWSCLDNNAQLVKCENDGQYLEWLKD
ncbi:hypothetical protein BJ684DRAFT_17430 [Piptocephalis cylindrospora]|uniref:Uncharacterized protein n=1 Tax=Piptocephalis cylindrospora TaxID=1907219 RepID=A0A4P9XZX4_9FUNG|nr:hypothetical protein BJ684DRAFT_17430 [Piptocephalis cylindrospora]|eukprot:RKP12043.1 hypothetical protein BJ684DRAFT_17430 [Piptocephalis cylindrospora]